ncbi:holo-[acyl-carrier-protein] synthase [Candidatus Beckwithbacteria bacterium RBG_13_42_9]|uniref:Holo-[acyl-carrier-protein] synthase n=1 Tax=Candidatus Beckwithbacteria bacterium RBG_13_42_9 TaxID=1797457 RepID=A0A1F5E7W8_9BACT|nr:MAG: holo-[acyl-carrier-protein] synthase [Candidatus Beckwithbacteria bacterium RBG_13_42_9]
MNQKKLFKTIKEKNCLCLDIGIGVDIENIERFKKIDRSKDRLFLKKIFTKIELEYCYSKKNSAPYLAARFAAKEAVVKSLTSLNQQSMPYNQIEVYNNEKGLPFVRLLNKKLSRLKIKISLSHCKDKALAFAIII